MVPSSFPSPLTLLSLLLSERHVYVLHIDIKSDPALIDSLNEYCNQRYSTITMIIIIIAIIIIIIIIIINNIIIIVIIGRTVILLSQGM